MDQENLTLVMGGAASGKSAFAERLVEAAGRPKVYLATAQALDAEMVEKIRLHLERRGDDWSTVEAPQEAAEHLGALAADQICLFDCATMWLSNKLLMDADLPAETDWLMAAIRACPAHLVVVTNEVGHGIVPENALSRRFREAQGRLNIALAAQAGTVVQVVAGLPRYLKGAP